MKKKWLAIGISITAVVLLTLTSFSNVVGYQSVKSTAMNDSPLFKTRTQRATNLQQNVLTFQYLGMGKGNLLQFQMRDSNIGLLKRTIKSINQMDDKTFEQFTELCIKKVKQSNILRDINPNEIVYALHLLKTNPETSLKSIVDYDNYNLTSSRIITLCDWVPFCIAKLIIVPILTLIIFIGFEIMQLLTVGATTGHC